MTENFISRLASYLWLNCGIYLDVGSGSVDFYLDQNELERCIKEFIMDNQNLLEKYDR